MSKHLMRELETSLVDGSIYELVHGSTCLTDMLEYLGFSRGTTKYVKIIRDFLQKNNIPIEHINSSNRNELIKPEIIDKVCPICKGTFKVSSKNTKKLAQVTCSIGCSNTYFRSGINHPNYKDKSTYNKYRYREVALEYYGEECQMCGFNNPIGLVVHHIDENRSNNEIDNLIVLCGTCHLLAHNGNTNIKMPCNV